ncbi:glycosyltransferase family 8 protein [Stenotrophomonas sp. CFBP 13725]|nr:glycosyltransferase family 8 protein [Stenotrophomonas sp. CFBP 13725]MBD8637303.1 glycosyltransferase family 8 protein [Stenotrophomonas sp. CFBP 13725]
MSSSADVASPPADIHVCLCADGRYVDFIVPAVESIVRSAEPGTRVAVDVIIDHEPKPAFRQALEMFCPERSCIHVISADQFGDLLEVTHISRGMYYRLMIPELVNADKVLYVDCDVLVRHDLKGIFATELRGALAAAVVNPFHDASRLGLAPDDVYFNSGVMLINTPAWREFGMKGRVLEYLRNNVDLLRMPDQDALNVVMRGKWIELDPTYNCQVSMLLRHKELARELAPRWNIRFLADPAIMHFSAGHKQWHASNRICFSKEYKLLSTHRMAPRRGLALDFLIGRLRQLKYSFLQANPYFY